MTSQKPELEDLDITISYAGIPTTVDEAVLIRLPPLGFIPMYKDNEVMHYD